MKTEYQLKEMKLKQLDRRLELKQKDWEAVNKQLEFLNDPPKELALKRQADSIYEDMEGLIRERHELEQKIQVLQKAERSLTDLANHLRSVQSGTLNKAYRLCLGNARPRQAPLESLLRQLAEIPGETEEQMPLICFVRNLLEDPSLEANLQRKLRKWAKDQGFLLTQKPHSISKVESSLMIRVKSRGYGYLVNAALIIDPDPFNEDGQIDITPTSSPPGKNPNYAPGYARNELPQVISLLINSCGDKVALTDLVVQLFLPMNLLSQPIEHWQIPSGTLNEQCIGHCCKAVIIRSTDRNFNPDYKHAVGNWKKYWQRFNQYKRSHCKTTLTPLDFINGTTNIDWTKEKIVGCNFQEHHNFQEQEKYWDQLLGQGLPIALWGRHLENNDPQPIMNSVTNRCPLGNLPKKLQEQRGIALATELEADRLKAAPLALLWDNPFRPFPSIDYQSI